MPTETSSAIEKIQQNEGLTPVRFDLKTEKLHWHDLGLFHMYEGSYHQSLQLLQSLQTKLGSTEAESTLCNLAELETLTIKTVPPSLFIFHLSRCGSTLFAKALAQSRRHIVYGEPSVLDHLWQWTIASNEGCFETPWTPEQARYFKRAIQSLGRRRLSSYEYYCLKFPSLYTTIMPKLGELFPNTKLLYMYRDPLEVLVSLQQQPYKMLKEKDSPLHQAALMGMVPPDKSQLAYAVTLLEGNMLNAIEFALSGKLALLDYAHLAVNTLPTILEKLNIKTSTKEQANIARQLNYYSKSFFSAKTFAADSLQKQTNAQADALLLYQERLAPLYKQLKASTHNVL